MCARRLSFVERCAFVALCVDLFRRPLWGHSIPPALSVIFGSALMSTELGHRARVRLADIPTEGSQILWHMVAGEAVRLIDGPWELGFDGEDTAFLTKPSAGDDDISVWANDRLDLSVHDVDDDQGGSGRVLFSQRLGQRIDMHVRASEVEVIAIRCKSGSGDFVAEGYRHGYPVGTTGSKQWWCLPWLQHAVLGDSQHNRWICRNYPRLVDLFRLPLARSFRASGSPTQTVCGKLSCLGWGVGLFHLSEKSNML